MRSARRESGRKFNLLIPYTVISSNHYRTAKAIGSDLSDRVIEAGIVATGSLDGLGTANTCLEAKGFCSIIGSIAIRYSVRAGSIRYQVISGTCKCIRTEGQGD